MRIRGRTDSATKLSEKHIQETCTAFLELDRWRALKTDPVSRREWAKGFGELGMADHLYIRYVNIPLRDPADPRIVRANMGAPHAEVLWIEWKSKRGKPKPNQLEWHRAERARGALTLIAGEDFPATIEGFKNWYRESGLMRNTSIKMK